MNRIAGIITLVVLMCCVTSTTYAQSEQLAARFAMLDVNDASDYLMLAEELADEANTPDEVRRLAETTYGRVTPQGARPERLRAREPEPKALRRVAVADPKVEQPTLQRPGTQLRGKGNHDL